MSTLSSGFTRRGLRVWRLHAAATVSSLHRGHVSRLCWLAIVLVVIAGCTLIAPYDEVTDRALTDLSIRTETILARADNGQLSAAEGEKFLVESIGAVRALKARAGLKTQNEDERGALADLEEEYQALADRGKPLRSSVATGLRGTLLSAQQIQIAKKRSAAFGQGQKKSGSP